MQRIGQREIGDLAGLPIDVTVYHQIAAVDQHPDVLDGIEGHSARPLGDRFDHVRCEIRSHARDQGGHLRVREGAEAHR